ncbi:hypothetical protein F511_05800 [Dorcoceras hygrometricum]|uniref:Uncharacterized protein n=1 Tax=Dorcoceras hygrometricum TaxID=472368 RepID=A0A2Z7B6S4_9LAMI|nr:hypothetical protein F511_05800 [Dorcoceras hygrometricum]
MDRFGARRLVVLLVSICLLFHYCVGARQLLSMEEGVSKVTYFVESRVVLPTDSPSDIAANIAGEDHSTNQEKFVDHESLDRRSLESVPSPGIGH